MVKEAYVTFSTAKLLKEKGFNGLCNAYYDCFNTDNFHDGSEPTDFNSIDTKIRDVVSAPSLALAMKWLREVHKLNISLFWDYISIPHKYNDIGWSFTVGTSIPKRDVRDWPEPEDEEYNKYYQTYEEAAEIAIIYTLKNLL